MTKHREEVKRMIFFPTAEFRNQDRAEYIKKQNTARAARQQEEGNSSCMKAAEKRRICGRRKTFQSAWDFNRIQIGDPYAMEHMRKAIGVFSMCWTITQRKNQQKEERRCKKHSESKSH
jgi:hypothetical protein